MPPPQLPRHYTPVLPAVTASPLPDPQRTASPLLRCQTSRPADNGQAAATARGGTESQVERDVRTVARVESPAALPPADGPGQSPPHGNRGGGEQDLPQPAGNRQVAVAALTERVLPARLPAAETRPAECPRSTSVRHCIVDGDTLETLAEKYLGSPDRAPDIYRENQQVLPAPDLLPIGAELVIHVPAPPREQIASSAATPPALPLVPLTAADIAALRARTDTP